VLFAAPPVVPPPPLVPPPLVVPPPPADAPPPVPPPPDRPLAPELPEPPTPRFNPCGDVPTVVVGVGLSSTAIAGLLKAFGMRVVGVSRTPRAVENFDTVMPAADLAAAAAQADYLVNVLPGDAHNVGSIGRAVFQAMKPSAYFINVGRGETVDEAALLDALTKGSIAGAGLDVFHKEPLPQDSPFWDLPNVFMQSHIGGLFREYEDYVMPIVIENMRLFLAGRYDDMRNRIAQ